MLRLCGDVSPSGLWGFVFPFRWLTGVLIESFNGKPQALPLDFAYACGSPLNAIPFKK